VYVNICCVVRLQGDMFFMGSTSERASVRHLDSATAIDYLRMHFGSEYTLGSQGDAGMAVSISFNVIARDNNNKHNIQLVNIKTCL
jgi:hypothetical protein